MKVTGNINFLKLHTWINLMSCTETLLWHWLQIPSTGSEKDMNPPRALHTISTRDSTCPLFRAQRVQVDTRPP
jgi:hypothetical protein